MGFVVVSTVRATTHLPLDSLRIAGASTQHAIAFAFVVCGDAVASGVSNPGALPMGDAVATPTVALLLLDGGIDAGERKEMKERAVRPRLCCDEAEDTL